MPNHITNWTELYGDSKDFKKKQEESTKELEFTDNEPEQAQS